MVVFGSVIILIIVSMVLLGVSSRMSAFGLNKSELTFIKTEACLEEALVQLSRDDTYAGDTYQIDGLDCDVAVSGSGDERTVTLDAEEEDYYHDFVVQVQLDPSFVILNFSY